MKDEIKEILENLKNKSFGEYELEYVDDVISRKDIKLLLDCITNLQEENDMSKEYYMRNKKAIEYLNNLTNYRFEFTFDNVDRHEIVGCTHNFVKDLLNILNGGDK